MSLNLADRVLEMACAIQQIPSPTFSEGQRAAYVFEQFKLAGLEQVYIDGTGNVLAKIPGRGIALPLVVSAHLDTVFPTPTDLTLKKETDKLYGPGIGDNSLGVAALFAVLWGFFSEPRKPDHTFPPELPGDVWLVANVGEEGLGDLIGMRAIVDHFGDQVKAYLVVEGMSLGQIYHRALGVQRYRITARTAGGHSWVDFGKPSAIHELSRLVNRLEKIGVPSSPRTTYNVGVISGGTSVNTIASEASLELDLRSEDLSALQTLIMQVQRLVGEVSHPGVELTYEVIGSRPAGALPISHPLITLAQQALLAQGYQPSLVIGSTDANIPLSRGYPAVCIGITHGYGAHTTGEYIETAPVSKGISQLIELVRSALSKL